MADTFRTRMKGLFPDQNEFDIDALFTRSVTVFNVVAGTTEIAETQCWMAPHAGRITSVYYVPDIALATDATHYCTLTLNKNPLSAYGTHVEVATHSTNSTGGTAMAADTPWALSTYTTPANRTFVEGDAFTFSIVDADTTTEPTGCLVIEYMLEDN